MKYKNQYVVYSRFTFDIISLFGERLFVYKEQDVDAMLRALYSQITYVDAGANSGGGNTHKVKLTCSESLSAQ